MLMLEYNTSALAIASGRALLTEARNAYEKIVMPKHVEMAAAPLKEAGTA